MRLPNLRQKLADRDLSDFLSPLLVKELRQGIRTKVFAGSLIILQALMLAALSTALLEPDRGHEASTALFWVFAVVPIALAPAGAGAVSLAEERKLNTLETMLLTPLSPRRIVFGKWCAAFAQSVILASSVMPYLLLRYFLGGVDVVAELAGFVALLLAAGFLTAANVSLGGTQGAAAGSAPASGGGAARAILGLFVALFMLGQIPALAMAFSMGMGMGFREWGLMVGSGLLSLLVVLEAGALQLAHPAQRASWRLRLSALLAVALVWAGGPGPHRGVMAGWSALLLLPVTIASLCEQRPAIVSLYAPWFSRGRLRRAGALLFSPGWCGGVVFATLAVTAWMALFRHEPDWGRYWLFVLATLLLPLWPTRRLIRETQKLGTAYLFFHFLAMAPSLFVGILAAFGSELAQAALPWCTVVSPPLAGGFFNTLSAGQQAAASAFAFVPIIGAWYEAVAGWSQTAAFVADRSGPGTPGGFVARQDLRVAAS